MSQESVSVSLPQALVSEIESIASLTGQSKEDLLTSIVSNYLASEINYLKDVENAIQEAQQNKLTPHEKVKALWEARRANHLD